MGAKDFEALNREILTETEKLAAAYQEKFAGDPGGELGAWLLIAARREAMVSDVYGFAERNYRLPEPRGAAGDVAWDALTLIWQQEVGHTKFIEVRLKDGVLQQGRPTAEAMLWLGTMEGKFLGALTSRPSLRKALAGLATRLGALFTPAAVPPFTLELDEMDPREFFLLCAALETTARQSYERMEKLTGILADRAAHKMARSLQLESLKSELRLKKLDETFHEEAFQEMATWVVEGTIDPGLDGRASAQRLARLLPRAGRDINDRDSPNVITDGGLGQLFKQHQIPINVLTGRGDLVDIAFS